MEGRLRTACLDGDLETVKELCRSNPELPNSRRIFEFELNIYPWEAAFGLGRGTLTWFTGLHLAASAGHVAIDCCEFLLDAGADIDAKDGRGFTPLMLASSLAVVELLLSRGANVHATNNEGRTVLHRLALFAWNHQSASALVAAGADIDAIDRYGNSPLMTALMAGYHKTGVELVKLGARDVNRAEPYSQKTLLHFVAEQLKTGEDDIETLAAAGADLEVFDKKHRTPLFVAVTNANLVACCKLIQLGANVNAEDKNGMTPLLEALRCSSDFASDLSSLLIDNGAVLRTIDVVNASEAFLRLAAKNGHVAAVHKFVEAGADLEGADRDGNTALVLAAQNGRTQTVQALVKSGARVNAYNRQGTSPLLVALGNGHFETAAELLKAGADPCPCDNDGCTALHLAARNGHVEIARKQVQVHGEIDKRTNAGETALHMAAAYGQSKTAVELVKLGVHLEAEDNRGCMYRTFRCSRKRSRRHRHSFGGCWVKHGASQQSW